MSGKVDFMSNRFDYKGDGIISTVTKDTSKTIDYKMPEDLFINGGEVFTDNAIHGDYFKIEIIDIDNILGYGANTVLKTYIIKHYQHSTSQSSILDNSYAGKILKDLYVRLTYTSTGTTDDVCVIANYYLHKEV